MAGPARPVRAGASAWRFGVPVVCLLAGLLLAATHGVSGGGEIRRSDAPRLVDLVREAQRVGRPAQRQRDDLVDRDRHPSRRVAGRRRRADGDPAPQRHPGRRRRPRPDARARPRRHPHRRPARRQRPVPARRLARRPGRAPAGHPGGAERAVERRRRRHPDAGSADHRHLGAAMRRQHAAAQRTHLQPAVRHHRDRRRRRHAGGPGGGPAGHALQAVRGAVRARLHRGAAGAGRPRRPHRAGADAVRQAGGPIGY